MLNWYAGWAMLLVAFVTGAIIGVYFHQDDFLGGYSAFRRRVLRLGHIALAALGLVNIVFSLAVDSVEPSRHTMIASLSYMIGGIAMPVVCFLTAWRPWFRRLFFVPVTALILAAIQSLMMGAP